MKDRRIVLLTFAPFYCARCGQSFTWNKQGMYDWDAGRYFDCAACRTAYQFAGASVILEAADKQGGDLREAVQE